MRPAFDEIAWCDRVLTGENNPHNYRAPTNPARFGLIGNLTRQPGGFHGDAEQPQHIPLANTLCRASADLLTGVAPTFTITDPDQCPTGADFIAGLTTTDEFSALLHAAMISCSAHGWVWGRVVWNTSVDSHPWVDFVDADQAIPTFEYGRIVDVTFVEELPDPAGKNERVWRVLEGHTPWRITYRLFVGTHTNLGHQVPLDAHPDTTYLDGVVDADGGVNTGTSMLTAWPILNRDGNPKWRRNPQLRHMGYSDISIGGTIWGVASKVWSQIIYEVDACRSRLLVSEELLDTGKPGEGQSFDWGRDVFRLAQSGDADAAGRIEPIQFNLRIEQFREALDLIEAQALSAVGLSAITLGKETGGGGVTATEIRSKSTATLNTARGKGRMLRSGLSHILTAALQVDAALNNYRAEGQTVTVNLAEIIEETELDRTRAAMNLRTARAASTRYLVERLHPEWTPEQVDAEVAAIHQEDSPDPFMLPPDAPMPDGEV